MSGRQLKNPDLKELERGAGIAMIVTESIAIAIGALSFLWETAFHPMHYAGAGPGPGRAEILEREHARTLWVCVLGIAFGVALVVLGIFARSQRQRASFVRCPGCGNELGGDRAMRYPECGWTRRERAT